MIFFFELLLYLSRFLYPRSVFFDYLLVSGELMIVSQLALSCSLSEKNQEFSSSSSEIEKR